MPQKFCSYNVDQMNSNALVGCVCGKIKAKLHVKNMTCLRATLEKVSIHMLWSHAFHLQEKAVGKRRNSWPKLEAIFLLMGIWLSIPSTKTQTEIAQSETVKSEDYNKMIYKVHQSQQLICIRAINDDCVQQFYGNKIVTRS